MTMRDIYISLQKLSKIDLKTENCKILLFSFGCVLIVAMTTICLNLQSVSLLGHNKQELLYKNMMMRDTHISPQNLLKLISKCQK